MRRISRSENDSIAEGRRYRRCNDDEGSGGGERKPGGTFFELSDHVDSFIEEGFGI